MTDFYFNKKKFKLKLTLEEVSMYVNIHDNYIRYSYKVVQY